MRISSVGIPHRALHATLHVQVITLHTAVYLYDVCVTTTVHKSQVRNAMGEDAKETLVAVTTDEQREELITLANNLEEWLYDDG
jgi:hypothetical protein